MKSLKLVIPLVFTLLSCLQAGEVRFFRITGPAAVTLTASSADGYVTWINPPTNTTFTVQTARTLLGPSNWVDYVKVPVTNSVTTQRLFDPDPPAGMLFVPAGSFTMGNCMDMSEGNSDELPLRTVYVSAFYMDKYETTQTHLAEVCQWAVSNGYSFDHYGSSKAANHSVCNVSWYDVVKWCNARSEKEGRTPAYYTEAAQTNVYRTGSSELQNEWVKWTAGYRLPTEAEWEKAARGGESGHRFPWSDGDTISHSRANYFVPASFGTNDYTYDVSPTQGFHPDYRTGDYPYTSPVGSFAPNGYELCDMAGNLREWCWDWYDGSYYSTSPGADPRGPVTGSSRVLRGGGWVRYTFYCRAASRSNFEPAHGQYGIGFRTVLPAGSSGPEPEAERR